MPTATSFRLRPERRTSSVSARLRSPGIRTRTCLREGASTGVLAPYHAALGVDDGDAFGADRPRAKRVRPGQEAVLLGLDVPAAAAGRRLRGDDGEVTPVGEPAAHDDLARGTRRRDVAARVGADLGLRVDEARDRVRVGVGDRPAGQALLALRPLFALRALLALRAGVARVSLVALVAFVSLRPLQALRPGLVPGDRDLRGATRLACIDHAQHALELLVAAVDDAVGGWDRGPCDAAGDHGRGESAHYRVYQCVLHRDLSSFVARRSSRASCSRGC